jgi:hypothetical protein
MSRFTFKDRIKLDVEGAMATLEAAAQIASNLIDDKSFFMNTMCEVLNDVARLCAEGLEGPTRVEAGNIHSSIRCTIRFDGDGDSYMQCAPGVISISQMVCPNFPYLFTKTIPNFAPTFF